MKNTALDSVLSASLDTLVHLRLSVDIDISDNELFWKMRFPRLETLSVGCYNADEALVWHDFVDEFFMDHWKTFRLLVINSLPRSSEEVYEPHPHYISFYDGNPALRNPTRPISVMRSWSCDVEAFKDCVEERLYYDQPFGPKVEELKEITFYSGLAYEEEEDDRYPTENLNSFFKSWTDPWRDYPNITPTELNLIMNYNLGSGYDEAKQNRRVNDEMAKVTIEQVELLLRSLSDLWESQIEILTGIIPINTLNRVVVTPEKLASSLQAFPRLSTLGFLEDLPVERNNLAEEGRLAYIQVLAEACKSLRSVKIKVGLGDEVDAGDVPSRVSKDHCDITYCITRRSDSDIAITITKEFFVKDGSYLADKPEPFPIGLYFDRPA